MMPDTDMTNTTTLKKSMFELIERHGFHIIPLCSIGKNKKCTCGSSTCSSPGKHPHFKYNWKLVASNDIKKIKSWTNKYKNLNWGILTGKKSIISGKYLIVVDVDKREHEICNKLPKTFSYSTGNGFHYWYWSDKLISNSVSLVDDKVDVRCSNGYVVIPPSKHISGRSYKLLNNDNFEIVDAPDFIINPKRKINSLTKEKKPKEVSSKSNPVSKTFSVMELRTMIKMGKRFPMGMRNSCIHKLLSSDRAKGMEREELLQKALEYKGFCEFKNTVKTEELERIIDSVMKYPPYCTLNKYQIGPVALTEIDKEFFASLKPTKTSTLTLSDISQLREKWYKEHNVGNAPIISMKMQELSGVLQSFGIVKKRIKSGNVWYCHG